MFITHYFMATHQFRDMGERLDNAIDRVVSAWKAIIHAIKSYFIGIKNDFVRIGRALASPFISLGRRMKATQEAIKTRVRETRQSIESRARETSLAMNQNGHETYTAVVNGWKAKRFSRSDFAMLFMLAILLGAFIKFTLADRITMGYEDYRLGTAVNRVDLNAIQDQIMSTPEAEAAETPTPNGPTCNE